MAMKIFRLLKKRRHGTSIVEEVVALEDGGGSWERKREVVRTSQRAIAQPTFRILGDDIDEDEGDMEPTSFAFGGSW